MTQFNKPGNGIPQCHCSVCFLNSASELFVEVLLKLVSVGQRLLGIGRLGLQYVNC